MLISIPTKDRPDSLAMCLTGLLLSLDSKPAQRIWIYDDGDSPATASYAVRFAMDALVRAGHLVTLRRGVATGIKGARVRMLVEASMTQHDEFVMIDDDIIVKPDLDRMLEELSNRGDVQYAVPVVQLANNEAGVKDFEQSTAPEWDLTGRGIISVPPGLGSWTCCIAIRSDRVDLRKLAADIALGPEVAEDYALTVNMAGIVVQPVKVWHAMGPAQGERAWNSLALQELRKQVGGLNEPVAGSDSEVGTERD